MKVLAECPVCENRIEVTAQPNQDESITCNLCNNSFDLGSNRINETKSQTVAEPTPIASRNGDIPSAQPVPTASPVDDELSLEPLDEPVLQTSNANPFEVAASTKARAMLKRRRSPVVPIFLGLAALASGAALIAVIVITDPFRKPQAEDDMALNLDSEDKDQDADSETDPNKKDSDTEEIGDSVFRTGGQSDEVEAPPTNAPPDKPPKLASNRFITKNQIQDFWDQQFWYFVRLRVDTGESSHYVSGTIVDSRGWVATSLSAVANAKEIEVQLAASNLKQFNGVQLTPTDLVRGVIKVDPESDLVLLSINRDFVPNSPGVVFGTSNNLVASQNVIQCACPGTENLAWPKEAQLDGRVTYEDFDFDFKSQFDENKMNKSQTFIKHSGYTDTAKGAAIFSEDGKLVGINTGVTDDSREILAATVEKLTELISSSEDNPLGLSVLNQ